MRLQGRRTSLQRLKDGFFVGFCRGPAKLWLKLYAQVDVLHALVRCRDSAERNDLTDAHGISVLQVHPHRSIDHIGQEVLRRFSREARWPDTRDCVAGCRIPPGVRLRWER